ncbi:hypothetical protein K431DRAFT_269639 [Polychaeton citri CBS 116435]|uniref:NYN domain-containing protein n=1 Tax=Polychaeton citri CBS 116435 TaxID=1314669 RepID=A0A9P4Q9Y6_9PEZI|nr:hypothetical protein K431DRAFT_269639 [Polychaeton citri CBS 116435]
MTTQTEVKPWDFSKVLGLLKDSQWQGSRPTNKSIGNSPPTEKAVAPEDKNHVARNDFAVDNKELGDFSKIWQFLGTPKRTQADTQPPSGQGQALHDLPFKTDYASDGATYVNPKGAGKHVHYQDDISGGEQTTDSADAVYESPSVSQKKRKSKKQRRKERKAREAAEAIKNATVSESEADKPAQGTPAKKASAHESSALGLRSETIWQQLADYDATPRKPEAKSEKKEKRTERDHKRVPDQARAKKLNQEHEAGKTAESYLSQTPSQHRPLVTPNHKAKPQNSVDSHQTVKAWPVANTQQARALKFMPSTIQPPNEPSAARSEPPGQKQSYKLQQFASSTPTRTPRTEGEKTIIEPKIVRSGEDRENTLFFKILNNFPEDRRSMISPMNLVKHKDNNGIHVFVDAKNIFIGFNEQLKRARNIPVSWHVPPVHLSFDAFALLLERHRPVAKRIMAGSKPHVPAYDKAEELSYKTHIFDPVWKARELTERQKHFKAVDAGLISRNTPAPPASDVATSYGMSPHPSSHRPDCTCADSPEKVAPEFAKPAWVEQGVDEILHMEMLLSMVDHEEPSTMVVATGDAARAEYSDGFMAMVERALKKGWKVELVSWSKNISSLYRRREWTQVWEGRFRTIELDDYAEELLDM